MANSIRVTRTVDAKPETLFALLATPSRHPEFDGAGMLRGTEGRAGKVSEVGNQFIMNMNNAGRAGPAECRVESDSPAPCR